MWRLLEVGEVIREGDQYWDAKENRWESLSECKGQLLYLGDPVRRWAGEKTASPPDPGEGYRLLSVGEKIRENDEIYVGKWETVVKPLVGSVMRSDDKSLVRRKIHPVVEPVCVGDRVEVVSGTWAKSCGVVVYVNQSRCVVHDVEIKLDNVFVGGKPLTIRVSPSDVSAQKSAPKSVQTDPEWRLLEIGEVIREGDEYLKYDKFYGKTDCDGHVFSLEKHRSHRRRVRIESPGWRYLDAGETVRAGDEIKYCVFPQWRDSRLCSSFGHRVPEGHDRFFRRKTAPFAG